MTRDADPIRVIEAAYRLDGTDAEWLRGLAEALRPLLEGGHGVTAYAFDIGQPPDAWFEDAVRIDVSPAFFRTSTAFARTNGAAPAAHVHPEPLAFATDYFDGCGAAERAAVEAYFRRLGIANNLALRTIEPGGRGLCFVAGQAEPRRLDGRTRRLWARVSAHLAAARRLRAALAASAAPAAEAILAPSGRLEHAEGSAKTGSARAALEQAVLRQERARGRARSADREAVTRAWTALVSGRWSLVEQFERDGRRYLVARPNAIRLPDPRALTERERAVAQLAALGKTNKLIAYELGLSASTVAGHLTAAARKLGAGSRVELVARLSGAAFGPSGSRRG